MSGRAEVGVIGGSGLYRFLERVEEVDLHTPYGPPSGPIALGEVEGRTVAFLPRHGPRHHLPPHRVNYRANLWAMRELGVTRLLGSCAAGSLRADVHPGELVVLDQLVDRTHGRADTFFEGGVVGHVPFADPYCPELSEAVTAAAEAVGVTVHPRGTVVVIQGPRFSTRAESRWFQAMGWDVVNMTQYPEAVLARELGICYAGLALVTDYDTGVQVGAKPVTMQAAFEVLEANAERTRELLLKAIPSLSGKRACACEEGLEAGPLRSR